MNCFHAMIFVVMYLRAEASQLNQCTEMATVILESNVCKFRVGLIEWVTCVKNEVL